MQYFLKILLSAILIVAISEIAKRSSFWGSILASLPFISIIAFIFLYQETKDLQKISDLSIGIFWLVIPSLVLFLAIPFLIKKGLSFYPSLGLACLLTIGAYFGMTYLLKQFGMM